jgi:uncharacterized protein YoxC
MDTNTLLAVFTGVVTVAFVLQSFAILWMAISIKKLSSRVESLGKDLDKTIKSLKSDLEGLVTTVRSVTDKVHVFQDHLIKTGEIIRNRVASTDAFLEETTDAVRMQVIRIRDVVDTASRHVEEALDSLHHSVLAPVKEINAILTGVRVGLDVLLRRRGRRSATPHQDDEMFI